MAKIKPETPAGKVRRYVPQPHLIDGRNYTVVESSRAYVGREPGRPVMGTPQTPADVGRILGLHEKAHVAMTPDVTPAQGAARIAESFAGSNREAQMSAICARPGAADLVNVAEDTRVNSFLRANLGIDADHWQPVRDHFAKLGHAMGMKEIQKSVATCRAASDGLSTLLSLLPLRSSPGPDADRTAKKFIGRYLPDSISQAEKILLTAAVKAQDDLNLPDVSFDFALRAAATMIQCAADLEDLWARETREKISDELAESDEKLVDDAVGSQVAKVEKTDKPRWGRMRQESPMRTARISMAMRYNARYRATESGAVMRYPNRYCTDGSIFAAKRKLPGGTILVDVSGSMSLTAEQVESIVANAPLATVALYSGSHESGVLRIVAAKGTRVAGDDLAAGMSGGNCVDGPAIRWLADQSEPRIWISDGHVTGWHGSRDPFLIQDAFAAAKRGKVVRVSDADRAVELFKSPGKLRQYIAERFRTGDDGSN